MDNVIYLEADEEITSVVEKMKRTKSPIIGIVAPRNAVLLQSVVNLKLLKRQAASLKKDIALVTADRIGQNLALRIGLTVYANIHDTKPLSPPQDKKPDSVIEEDMARTLPHQGFKVHRYDEDESDNIEDEEEIETPAKDFSSKAVGEMAVSPQEAEAEEDSEAKGTDDAVEDEEPSDQTKEDNIQNFHKEEKQAEETELGQKSKVKEIRADDKDRKIIDTKDFSPLKKTKTKVNGLKIGLVGVIFLVIVAAIGYGALNSISEGTISITVESESISQDLAFQVSKDRTTNDNVKNILPGRHIESEQNDSQKTDATGKKDVGEKATGKITVTNEAGVSQSFEANTALRSSSGEIFRSVKAFTVPAASKESNWVNGKWVDSIKVGSVTIDVEANTPGSDYNINATNYTISGFSFVKGTGTAMTGGATKEVIVVSKEDIDKATKALTTDLTTKSLADLKKKAGSAVYLDKAVKTVVVEATSDTEADTQASDFTITVKVKSSVLVFDKSKLDELIQENLKSKIGKDKALLTADTNDLDIEVVSSDPEAGTMQLTSKAKGKIVPALDKTEIQSHVAGLKPSEIKSYYRSIPDIKTVDVNLSPSWWLKKMPSSKSKIKVNIRTK